MSLAPGIVVACCLALSASGTVGGLPRSVALATQDPVQAPLPPVVDPPKAPDENTKPQTVPSQRDSPSETPSESKQGSKNDAPGGTAREPSPQGSTKPVIDSKNKATNGAAPHRRGSRKRAAVPDTDGSPRKIVVREGGAREPAAQIVTGMLPEEAARQRQNSEDLLSSTEQALTRISQSPLSPKQQEAMSQIRNYMDGARSALKEGDIQRAHTLALKASLLADDLAKH